MRHIIILTLAGSLAAATPALAATDADITSDENAITKDNAALAKDKDSLAKDRAAKANAKANGDTMSQAKSSVAIGADKTVQGEKQTEKNVDKKILNHDVNSDSGQ